MSQNKDSSVETENKAAAENEKEATAAFLARLKISEASSTAYLSVASRKTWKCMLVEATALANDGNLKTAKEIFAEADEFLKSRAGEAARMWYVQATLACIFIIWLLYNAFDVSFVQVDKTNGADSANEATTEASEKPDTYTLLSTWEYGEDDLYTIKYVMLAMIGGASGAGFSLLIRVANLNVDPDVSRSAYYGEVIFRLTIGAMAAVIVIVGWQAEVFATTLKFEPADAVDAAIKASQVAFDADFWTLVILAFAAGYSERLAPSLLEHFSSEQSAEKKEPEAKQVSAEE